jgi:hypothetical protein
MKSSRSWGFFAALILLLSLAGQVRATDIDTAINNAWNLAFTKLNADVAYLPVAYPSDYLNRYPSDTYTATGPNYGKWAALNPYTLGGWGAGFFPGAMWLAYQHTGSATMLVNAESWTEGIKVVQTPPAIDHDIGFRLMTSFYNAYLILNDTTDPGAGYRAWAKSVILNGTATLDTRYNEGGVPVGALKCDDGWVEPYGVIIDSMMNTRLYFIAWDLSGRPTTGAAYTWYQHAVHQANVEAAQNVRSFAPTDPRAADDGSSYQVVEHNDGTHGTTANGQVYKKLTAAGFANESTWSRGQAWGLYGFAETYRYTMNDPSVTPSNFLNTARRMADYFIAHLPNNYTPDPYNHVVGDFVPPSDFDAALGEPVGPWNSGSPRSGTHAYTARDSSAAAIAASGLFDLYVLDPDPVHKAKYFQAGENILYCLLTFTGTSSQPKYLGTAASPLMGILIGASDSYDPSGTTNCLMWADYYFLEAMTRYQALTAPLQGSATLTASDGGWVYQNSSATLANNGGHLTTLTATVQSSSCASFTMSVTQTGPGVVTVLDDPGGNPLVKLLRGSLRSDDVIGVGDCHLHVVVTSDLGTTGQTDLVLAVRRLGDINGDGVVTTADRVALNLRLNGLYSGPLSDRAFDLNHDGLLSAAADRALLNAVLNGLPTP